MINKKPEDAEQMLRSLQTEAREREMVGDVLFKVTWKDNFEENVKNLSTMKLEDLRRTYAFLMDCSEEEERITELKHLGIRKMLMHRLIQLMPQVCLPCNGAVHYLRPGEEANVVCRRCKKAACPTCYPQGEEKVLEAREVLMRYKYLCEECDVEVEKHSGVNRLDASDFRKEKSKKKTTNETITISEEPAEEKDDADDEKEEENNEENEENDGNLENDNEFAEANKKVKGNETKSKKETAAKKEKPKEKVKKICHHLLKGRCSFGLSGRKHHDGKTQCPFNHPRVCDRLLRHGDRGAQGCKEGKTACSKLHPKMCPNSLEGVCLVVGCKQGLHVNGTNTKEARERYEKRRGTRSEGEERREGGRRHDDTRHHDPALPYPAQPSALARVLGQPGSATPATTATFLDVATLVRQEMTTILKELKGTATTPPPPPPTKEKIVWDVLRGNKEEMRSILREMGFLGF